MQNFWNKEKILLLLIILLGTFFRFYNLNWDQNHHLHPDERAIIMFALPLRFPSSISEFLSPTSPLNPHFFAYGNFPLYILKGTAVLLSVFDKSFDSYDRINLLGRAISSIADIGTIILIYFIGKKIFNKTAGTIAAFFYSISVLPIQTSHFYAVDSLLTFFISFTLLRLIIFYDKSTTKNSIFVGIFFALSLATKVSAIPLIIAILTAICVDFALVFLKKPHKVKEWFPHVPLFFKRLIIKGTIIILITAFFFVLFQPYSIINFQEFLRQMQEQSRMTKDAFTFPYTLQYVGKIPYWYELKNIFLWGQGPILATFSFLGIIYISLRSIVILVSVAHPESDSGQVLRYTQDTKPSRSARMTMASSRQARTIIILSFFIVYFLIVGKFAVGWMRYTLPLYPLLSLFGAVLAYKLFLILKFYFVNHKSIFYILNSIFLILVLFWSLAFMHIYTKPNTRVLASEWIYRNIPSDKVIAREHWDDGLPIGGYINYKTLELPIYDMQNPTVETQIYQTIQKADYIIVASNRLYIPLQRISKNCQKWNVPEFRCSRNANRYYENLFSGKLGYKKVAEFSNYPKLAFPLVKWEHAIDDQSADESFTVYDHPKIMVFKKNE